MDIVHFLLMLAIIAIIICLQLRYFYMSRHARKTFENIFPKSADEEWNVNRDGDVKIVSAEEQKLFSDKERLLKSQENIKSQQKKLVDRLEVLKHKINACLPNEFGNYPDGYSLLQGEYEKLSSNSRSLDESLEDIANKLAALDWNIQSLQEKKVDKTQPRYVIISAINNYLLKNKNTVTDFNLIKDIVDRNCDAKEEEIQTLNPIPLYLGLVGTMAGIIVGVLVLLFSGALDNMMSTFDPTALPKYPNLSDAAIEKARRAYEATATTGVKALLEGVGIAMISSILGIILTTRNSIATKNVKRNVEERKHNFLSWMQAELLPKISSDVSSALIKLGKDLNGFNSTFSDNATLLKSTINSVKNATTQQTKLLNAIQKVDVARIAEANISVYENLKDCSGQLQLMSERMHGVQSGLRNLSDVMYTQIDKYGQRMTYIQDASSKVDMAIGEAQNEIAKYVTDSFNKYKELLDNIYMDAEQHAKQASENYEKKLDDLHHVIVGKFNELRKLEDELKNLTAVKENIASLEKTTARQSDKLDKLAQSITTLANAKLVAAGSDLQVNNAGLPVSSSTTPKWLKLVLWFVGIVTWAWLIAWTILTMMK